MIEASSKALLYSPVAQGHFVQFYKGDEPRLTANIVAFLGRALKRGEAALMVSTAERWSDFETALAAEDVDLKAAVSENRAVFIDAPELLERIRIDGDLNYQLFEAEVGGVIGRVRREDPERGVRAYGDAVGYLWSNARKDDAEVLEHFWGRLHQNVAFTLMCGYPVDVLSDEFNMENVDAVLCTHTHLLPSCDEFRLENALRRAMHEVLGPRAEGMRKLMKANYRPSWGMLPRVEASVLWLRNNLPDLAESILTRARVHSAT